MSSLIEKSEYPEPRIELEYDQPLITDISPDQLSHIFSINRMGKIGLICKSVDHWNALLSVIREYDGKYGRSMRYTATSDFSKKDYRIYIVWRPS